MALDKSTLKASIKSAYESAQTIEDKDQAAENLANAIADAIDVFVKSGTVAFVSGKVVGTCAGPGNPLTVGAATDGVIS